MHLFTNYQITDKPIADMTLLQYKAVLEITEQIIKYKQRSKPMVVI